MKFKLFSISLILLTNLSYAEVINSFSPKIVDNQETVKYFNRLLPTTTINKIYTTPYPDTYALVIGSNLVYGNTHSNYLTSGHMFNIYTQDDITQKLMQENAPKIDISKIDISDAVKIKSKNKVNKKLIFFVDPDCPYCRVLEKQIVDRKVVDKADLYYILMPLPMHPNAKAHTKNILCAKNPGETIKVYMYDNDENPKVNLEENCNIEPVLERVGSITRALNINATPTIITGTGEMIMGADMEAINKYLSQ